jgi:hypothetical protein
MARRQGAVVVSLLAAVLLGACLPAPAAAGVHLSTLPKALDVTASAKPGQGARPSTAPARIASQLSLQCSILPFHAPAYGSPARSQS